METSQFMYLMELMFQKSYNQGKKDSEEGVHICPKELYKQFKNEHYELFINLPLDFLHSKLDTSNHVKYK